MIISLLVCFIVSQMDKDRWMARYISSLMVESVAIGIFAAMAQLRHIIMWHIN